jgi:TPR repeat protein
MRLHSFLLTASAAVFLMNTAAGAADTTVVAERAAAPKCIPVKGDDATTPKIIPNLNVGREELRQNHFQRAAAHFSALAEGGNIEAEREYGQLLLREGCNIPTDKKAGASWLHKAAKKQDAIAQFAYAGVLLYGNGADVDEREAMVWAKRAATAGNPQAQVLVGYLYTAGRGVKMDKHEGIVWAVKAAEQGAPVALSNLAKSYLMGEGVPKNLHQAMVLITTAIERIPPNQYALNSKFQLTRYAIAHLLSVEEVRAAEKEAEKWSPGPDSLAKVLSDAGNWKAGATSGGVDHDLAD